MIATPLEVRRFRATGLREPRVMEITTSPAYVPAPFRTTDPARAEPQRDAPFETTITTGEPFAPDDGRIEELRLSVRGVDLHPPSSSIGRIGDRPGHETELLTTPDGARRRAWDGFARTGDDPPGGFVGVAYPDAGPSARGVDLRARFDAAGEAAGVLECDAVGRHPVPQCKLHRKVEPLFVQASFDRRRLGDLEPIAERGRGFTRFSMEGAP